MNLLSFASLYHIPNFWNVIMHKFIFNNRKMTKENKSVFCPVQMSSFSAWRFFHFLLNNVRLLKINYIVVYFLKGEERKNGTVKSWQTKIQRKRQKKLKRRKNEKTVRGIFLGEKKTTKTEHWKMPTEKTNKNFVFIRNTFHSKLFRR